MDKTSHPTPTLPGQPARQYLNSNGDPITTPVSYDEFFDWLDEDTHAEWVDGEIEMTSPATARHQKILSFLYGIVNGFVELNDLGVVLSPFHVRLPRRGREPDLVFLAKEHLDRLQTSRIDGSPDIVVEVVSPESTTRDRQTKLQEYRSAGVPEYWLIDPLTDQATFYRLSQDSQQYQTVALDAEGKYHSQVLPGFWLKPAWFWEPNLPMVNRTLLQIAGNDFARQMLDDLDQEGFGPPNPPQAQ